MIKIILAVFTLAIASIGCTTNADGEKCFFLSKCLTESEAAQDYWVKNA